jgi:hypothetical protein
MFSYKRTFMKLRHSILTLLALTMIPSGMAFTAADTAQQNQDFEAILQQYKKPEQTPEKPLTIWEKVKKKLAWFNVSRVLGITGIIFFGWIIKRQFFSSAKPVSGKKELKFRNGYRDNLKPPATADKVPIVIQLPNGKQIHIEQIGVVPQRGPSCPYHSSVNAEILAQGEIDEKQRDAQRANAKDPRYVGQRVEAAAEHIEKVLNGKTSPRIEIFNADGFIPDMKRTTGEDGWAEASVVQEILAGSPGSAEIVSFQNGVGTHNEDMLRKNGVHRVVVAYQGAGNATMGHHDIHYFTLIINRQDNNVRYVIADSLDNADRRRAGIITRLMSQLEQRDTSDAGITNIYDAITEAIGNPARPAHVRNKEARQKDLGGNPPSASAPKPTGNGNPATATATPTGTK